MRSIESADGGTSSTLQLQLWSRAEILASSLMQSFAESVLETTLMFSTSKELIDERDDDRIKQYECDLLISL